MTYKTLQTNFERELLFQIILKMRQKKLEKGQAKGIAKAFLTTLKSQDEKEFIEKNAKLCESYPEILEAFLVTVNEFDKEKIKTGLNTIREEMFVVKSPSSILDYGEAKGGGK